MQSSPRNILNATSRKRSQDRADDSADMPSKKRMRSATNGGADSARPIRRMRKYSVRPGWLDDFATDGEQSRKNGTKKTAKLQAKGKKGKQTPKQKKSSGTKPQKKRPGNASSTNRSSRGTAKAKVTGRSTRGKRAKS